MSQSISQKKLEANRRNAQHSTGPRSVEGKLAVSCNAVKHGLLAEHVVIRGSEETEADFASLLLSLRDHYRPVGIQEDLLVQQIAGGYWCLARAQRYEKAQAESRLLGAPAEQERRHAEQVQLAISHLPDPHARMDLLRTSMGVQYLVDVIGQMKNEVSADASMRRTTVDCARRHFGEKSAICRAAAAMLPADPPSAVPSAKDSAEGDAAETAEKGPGELDVMVLANSEAGARRDARRLLEQALEEEVAQLGNLRKDLASREAAALEKNRSGGGLLDPEMTRLLLRYETTHDRKIMRAQNQLERLQRQRRGEFVPAPVRVELC